MPHILECLLPNRTPDGNELKDMRAYQEEYKLKLGVEFNLNAPYFVLSKLFLRVMADGFLPISVSDRQPHSCHLRLQFWYGPLQ